MDELERPCRVCGLTGWMRKRTKHDRGTRFDAQTCSGACRVALHRGRDLAYLRDWHPALAHARRSIHRAIADDVAIQKMRTAMARERRAR